MFQELMPLLAHRVLVLTLSRINSEEICLNVLPRPLKAGEKDDNNALTTPLSLSGTPAELDQELPRQLAEFVRSHLELSSTLQTAKAEMAAAAKTAKEAAKRTAAPKPSSSFTAGVTAAADHANSSTASPKATPAPAAGSLFEGCDH
jgi:PRTRC genetic system protein E